MTHVAFFRNVNLGHSGSPTGAELVEAFGGPAAARCFQTNGTVVFDADDPVSAAGAARENLRARGFLQTAVIRSIDDIRQTLASSPSVNPDDGIYRSMISFYDVDIVPEVALPLRSSDELVEIRLLGPDCAHGVCWKPRTTAGNVTGFLEKLLGVPVTTRTTATIERLVRTHSQDGR